MIIMSLIYLKDLHEKIHLYTPLDLAMSVMPTNQNLDDLL